MKVDGTHTAIQIDAYLRQNHQQQGAGVQENQGQAGGKVDKVQISRPPSKPRRLRSNSRKHPTYEKIW